MTHKELSQLYWLNKRIDNLENELLELETKACGCTSNITGMPHGGGVFDKIGSYAVKIVELKSLINLKLQECLIERNRIERYINTIKENDMALMIRLRYINGMSYQQIGDEMGYDRTSVAKKIKKYVSHNSHSNSDIV